MATKKKRRIGEPMPNTRNVGILIFNDVEVLDFCGPFEVFSVTSPRGVFNVFTLAATLDAVLTRGGLSVNPKYTLADAPAIDLLVIPGGLGTRPLMHDAALIGWIRDRSGKAELVLSVCTGALLLGKAGLLDGLSATTHQGAIDLLRETAPQATVCGDRRVVDNGKVITSGGIAAGIDISLHVVERLLGLETAQATAKYMEYPWTPR
jgi:transcriptional regulator GlxA family with amidase domain